MSDVTPTRLVALLRDAGAQTAVMALKPEKRGKLQAKAGRRERRRVRRRRTRMDERREEA